MQGTAGSWPPCILRPPGFVVSPQGHILRLAIVEHPMRISHAGAALRSASRKKRLPASHQTARPASARPRDTKNWPLSPGPCILVPGKPGPTQTTMTTPRENPGHRAGDAAHG